MSRQRVIAGKEIETVTPQELATLLQEFAQSGHYAFGSGQVERKRENWPTMGGLREIRAIGNAPHGSMNLVLAAAVYTDLLPANDGRGGVNVQNIGANPGFAFAATASQTKDLNGAVACGYLAPSGGVWDGRFGDAEWVGDICVYSQLGTTLCWGEI